MMDLQNHTTEESWEKADFLKRSEACIESRWIKTAKQNTFNRKLKFSQMLKHFD